MARAKNPAKNPVIEDPVRIAESYTVDNRMRPEIFCMEYKAINNTTGQMIAKGRGENNAAARSDLHSAMIAAGWTSDEIDQLLTKHDAAITASVQNYSS